MEFPTSPLSALAHEFVHGDEDDSDSALCTPGQLAANTLAEWKPVPKCCWCGQLLVQREIATTPAWVCPTQPCLQRQLRFAMTGKSKGSKHARLLYLPLPRQTEAHEAVESLKFRRILFGGAAGGGKSRFLRWLAYSVCMKYKNFNVLLLRRTFGELESTHLRDASREANSIGAKCTPSNKRVDFPDTGSLLKFGHCEKETDMNDYLSQEYDLILFDELVTFTETQYLLISSRARSSSNHLNWQPMVVGGTNPGGPGAAWINEMFIEKQRDMKKYPAYDPQAHCFIRSLLDDNPYVDKGYVEMLMDLPPEMREAYRWGNWDIFPGQYFKEFRKHLHVQRLYVPSDIPRLGGMDWGYLRPGIFLWAVPLDDGRLYIEREYVFQETAPQEVGLNIALLTRIFNFTLSDAVGDPAMGIRQAESGEDIFELLLKGSGGQLAVRASKNERINGWMRVRQWLRPLPNGHAGLVISPDCEYLARTLPQLMQDQARLEDVDTTGEDHAADALRYLVMSRPTPLLSHTPLVYPAGSAGELLAQLRAQLSTSQVVGAANVQS